MAKNTNKRYGFHSIESIINNNPHTIKKLFIPSSRDDKRVHQLISLAEKFEIKYEISNKLKKDPEAIVANSEISSFKDLKVFIEDSSDQNLSILILDNIIDPRNLGSCIRSAAVYEIDALIINKHHCAPLNEVAHNVSAGGAELINIFHVSNLINCLKYLRKSNIDIYGLSEHAQKIYTSCDFTNSSAIIMGSEESGMRQKTSESCNELIKLNLNKKFKSFNVSVATGIILSEISRQRG